MYKITFKSVQTSKQQLQVSETEHERLRWITNNKLNFKYVIQEKIDRKMIIVFA